MRPDPLRPGRWWPVAAWGIARLAGLVLVTGASFYPQVDDDVQYHYFLWADLVLRHGLLPWKAFPIDYPPGVLPFTVLPGSSHIYELEFMVLAFIADALIARTLWRSGRGSLPLWGWIALPVLLGPVMWVRLDVFVAAALVGLVCCLEQRRWALAGFCVASATLLKIWPALLLILIFPLLDRSGRWRILWSSFATVVVATLPVVLWGGANGLWSMLQTQGGRGLEIETVWAWPAVFLRGLGASIGFLNGEGSPVVDEPLWLVRLWGLLLPLLVCVFAVWIWRLRPHLSLRAVSLGAASLVLIGEKTLSPQYVVWVGALTLLYVASRPGDLRRSRPLVAATGFLAVTTQLVYPFAYRQLGTGDVFALVAGTVHAVAVVGWTIVALRCIALDAALLTSMAYDNVL